MPLTRSFKDTGKARSERDPSAIRSSGTPWLTEAVDGVLAGDIEVGKAVRCDDIHAIIGFERLAPKTGSSTESLMRMLGAGGNPTAGNLFAILGTVEEAAGLRLAVTAGRSDTGA